MAAKLSSFLLLVVAVICLTYVYAEEEKRCTPGNSYFDGCNRCFCALYLKNNSNFLICSKNVCPHNYEKVPAPQDFWHASADEASNE